MKLFVPRESRDGETRVAASPDTVKKLVGHGFEVHVEKDAGIASGIPDDHFVNAGAKTATAKSQGESDVCLLYTSPSPRDKRQSRMPSSA